MSCFEQASTGASGVKEKNIFLIEKDGSSISWCPESDNLKANKMWGGLVKSLRKRFGGYTKLKLKDTPIKYNDMKNVLSSINQNENGELNKGNIEMYWKLLKSSKDTSQMYFYIGDLPKKR